MTKYCSPIGYFFVIVIVFVIVLSKKQ